MIHWSDARERLTAAASAPKLALGFDFDGTLAVLASRPEGVGLHPEIHEVLLRWSTSADPTVRMATITGRALEDVRGRVPIPGMRLAGNHGLELDDGRLLLEPPPAYRDQLELARMHLPARLAPFPGAWIEDKTLTLTIHLRPVARDLWPRVYDAMQTFVDEQSEIPGQAAIGLRTGKAVIEVRPPRGATKADAAAEFLRQWEISPSHFWFFGDDDTDEDVFRRFPQGTMVRVQRSETSAAPYFLDDPSDLARLLHWMADIRAGGR